MGIEKKMMKSDSNKIFLSFFSFIYNSFNILIIDDNQNLFFSDRNA